MLYEVITMRADRREDMTVVAGINDRTTRSEVITGGPGRRRNDQPVRLECRQVIAVDPRFHVENPCERTLVDDHIVENPVTGYLYTITSNDGKQPRITSYNVCYTKLLRSGIPVSGSIRHHDRV